MSTIGIHRIKEDEFTFKPHDLKVIDKEKLSLQNSLGFSWNLDEREFHLTFTVQYYHDINDHPTELVKFSTTTSFYVSDLNKLLIIEGSRFELPDDLMLTFVSTSIATTRGMLIYKLAGTLLADYYLPLINPRVFLENTGAILGKKTKKSTRNKT